MQFLRTLFWALLVGVLVAFAFNNWTSVDIKLWAGLVAQVNLPLLLLVVFLLGFVPVQIAYHAMRWRMKQRVASAERTIADMRAIQTPVTMPEPVSEPTMITEQTPSLPDRAEGTLPLNMPETDHKP